jgi:hypothetical protein
MGRLGVGGHRRGTSSGGSALLPSERFSSFLLIPMSQTRRALPVASGSSSNFQSIFDTALYQYKKKTKNDLVAHQLIACLENCASPSAILAVLNEQYGVQEFIQSQTGDERPKQWLSATANVLCAFSAAIGQGVGLVNTRISSIHLHPNIQSHRCSLPRM